MYKSLFFILVVLLFLGVSCNNQEESISPSKETNANLIYKTKNSSALVAKNPHFINIQNTYAGINNQIIQNVNNKSIIEKQEMKINLQALQANGGTETEYLQALGLNSTSYYNNMSYLESEMVGLMIDIPQLVNISEEELIKIFENTGTLKSGPSCSFLFQMCTTTAQARLAADSIWENLDPGSRPHRHLRFGFRLVGCTIDLLTCVDI
jgi:uncharacterized protein YdcH (DUF465 family)